MITKTIKDISNNLMVYKIMEFNNNKKHNLKLIQLGYIKIRTVTMGEDLNQHLTIILKKKKEVDTLQE